MGLINNKRAAMSISIDLLAVATLVLVVFALSIFSSHNNRVDETINTGQKAESIYSSAKILDFYILEIGSKIMVGDNAVEKFRAGLAKYKKSDGNYIYSVLGEIEKLLDVNHIRIENTNKLIIDFDITLSKSFQPENAAWGGLKQIVYRYKLHKEFRLIQNPSKTP